MLNNFYISGLRVADFWWVQQLQLHYADAVIFNNEWHCNAVQLTGAIREETPLHQLTIAKFIIDAADEVNVGQSKKETEESIQNWLKRATDRKAASKKILMEISLP